MGIGNFNVNNYLAPPSFSAGPSVEYNANWGVAPVVNDPQVNVHEHLKSVGEDELRSELRRARRKLLADLAGEFATSHDDLLRDLAR